MDAALRAQVRITIAKIEIELSCYVRAKEFTGRSNIDQVIPGLSLELVWETAVAGSLLDEMLITDLISNIRSGVVKFPRKYVAAAVRKTCEKHEIEFHKLHRLLPENPAKKVN